MDANIINGVLLNSVDYLNGVGSTSIATVNGVSWVSGGGSPPLVNSVDMTVYGPAEAVKGWNGTYSSGNTEPLNMNLYSDIGKLKFINPNTGYDLIVTNIEFYLSGWISTYFSVSYWDSPGNSMIWENPYTHWIKIDSGTGELTPTGGWNSGFYPTDIRVTFSYQESNPI